ncbi:MAG: 3-methyl-2-oxobutanoate dehydrogenase subunit beta, partial [Candidatus Goldbacteria bacterium]|nr:3-methyl-2-oxobutanoate dehydrogenase subunit beta [Candidatus Goldiibacteriota bacterium]
RDKKSEYLNKPKDWALTGAKGRPGRKIFSLMMKPGVLEKHNFHLKEKYDLITQKEKKYEEYHLDEKAEYLIVAFGTVARISKNIVKKDNNIKLFRPITLWPFPYQELKEYAKNVKKVFVFEMNLGQMVEDVKLALEGTKQIEFYGRPGGGVPTSEELYKFIQEKIK